MQESNKVGAQVESPRQPQDSPKRRKNSTENSTECSPEFSAESKRENEWQDCPEKMNLLAEVKFLREQNKILLERSEKAEQALVKYKMMYA